MRAFALSLLAVRRWAEPSARPLPPEVDEAEVLRLGDVVQSVGGGASSKVDQYVEALAPPRQ